MLERTLNTVDIELLRALDERNLFDAILDQAQHKIFKAWRDADAKDRFEIGHTADALQALTIEIKATVNEAHRNGRFTESESA